MPNPVQAASRTRRGSTFRRGWKAIFALPVKTAMKMIEARDRGPCHTIRSSSDRGGVPVLCGSIPGRLRQLRPAAKGPTARSGDENNTKRWRPKRWRRRIQTPEDFREQSLVARPQLQPGTGLHPCSSGSPNGCWKTTPPFAGSQSASGLLEAAPRADPSKYTRDPYLWSDQT